MDDAVPDAMPRGCLVPEVCCCKALKCLFCV